MHTVCIKNVDLCSFLLIYSILLFYLFLISPDFREFYTICVYINYYINKVIPFLFIIIYLGVYCHLFFYKDSKENTI